MNIDRYAVFGNPIEHSQSPLIHSLFAKQTNEAIEYDKQRIEKNNFSSAVTQFFSDGGKGLNITVPFKEEAWALVDSYTERAKKAGAVNTIIINANDFLMGDNTDGVGFIRDIISNHQIKINGKKILILGAGGAVRGVLGPLCNEKPESITIANRTIDKAKNLASLFSDQGVAIFFSGFKEIKKSYDLIINGTAASLHGELPPIPKSAIGSNCFCYDMMYSAENTPFNAWAETQGATKTADGLGMLVEQAAEAFFLWREKRPKTKAVIKQVRETLACQ